MTTYKVLSDNFAGKACGETVTAEELEGCSVEALIAGGHIEPAAKPTKKVEAE
jgi:hypothetical protein